MLPRCLCCKHFNIQQYIQWASFWTEQQIHKCINMKISRYNHCIYTSVIINSEHPKLLPYIINSYQFIQIHINSYQFIYHIIILSYYHIILYNSYWLIWTHFYYQFIYDQWSHSIATSGVGFIMIHRDNPRIILRTWPRLAHSLFLAFHKQTEGIKMSRLI